MGLSSGDYFVVTEDYIPPGDVEQYRGVKQTNLLALCRPPERLNR